jgi:hypothetical protein
MKVKEWLPLALSVYAAVIATISIGLNIYLARLDRRPRLRIWADSADEGESFIWRIVNTGRVDVTVERCGVVTWYGRRKHRLPEPIWLTPYLNVAPPFDLKPNKAEEPGVSFTDIANRMGGSSLFGKGKLKVCPVCEDQTGRRYFGKVAVYDYGPPVPGFRRRLLRWWLRLKKRLRRGHGT